MNNYLLEKAIEYASMGVFVFPAREKDGMPYKDKKGRIKVPKEKSPYTPNGLYDATNNLDIIKNWWNNWENACIGIDCERSNLFVIDIDVKNGKKGINNFMSMGIPDTGAWHSRTPSMGLHIVFSGIGKTSTNPNSGIDTRGKGGYFIAPPSKTSSGKYIALDDWTNFPIKVTEDILQKLNCSLLTKPKNKYISLLPDLTYDENIIRIKKALNNLPNYMVDSYQDWIEIGLSLYELGDMGLKLWDEWSKKSNKYEEGVCEEKWESFDPCEISLGSLFYYSKKNKE